MPPTRHRRRSAFFSGLSPTIASVVMRSAGDRGRALQREAHDLGRVDDAGLHHVGIVAVLGVEAVIDVALLQELADDDRAVRAGILGDQAGRIGKRAADDVDADLLVAVARAAAWPAPCVP